MKTDVQGNSIFESKLNILEAAYGQVVEAALNEIKSNATTYRQAIELARDIDWPKEKPIRSRAIVLKLIREEVLKRLENEFREVAIRK